MGRDPPATCIDDAPATFVGLPGKFLLTGLNEGGNSMRHKQVAAALCAAVLMGLSAGAALAGEVKGPPTGGTAATNFNVAATSHANSICVFSGQNDDPNAPIVSAEPTPEAPNGPGGRTQSYGQDVRYGLISPQVFNPGMACRGGSNPGR